MKKKQRADFGLVYSTNPDAMKPLSDPEPETTPPPQMQRLTLRLDKKQRGGKVVTLIENFAGQESDLMALAKKLKTLCGTGGSCKERQIIIQGDCREKIGRWLNDHGYTHTKIR